MSYLKFSRKLAGSLAKTHHLNEEKQLEITYAIEILSLNGLNAALTLIAGWALGVFSGTLACLITSAAFRHNAGGGHSESPWRCAIATITVFPVLALLAAAISVRQPMYINTLSLLAIIVGFVIIYIYAPVDNSKAPIVSAQRRRRLRQWAFLVMLAISAIIIGLTFFDGAQAAAIRMSLALSVMWVSFNLTPLGIRFWSFIDIIGPSRERRCTR